MSRKKRLPSPSTRLIGFDFSGLGDDPLSEIRLLAGVTTLDGLEERFCQEVETEVRAIVAVTKDCDAFDIIELLRLREFPVSPVAGLEPGFDGSGAVIDVISLVLLARNGRRPGVVCRQDSRPHELVPDLHTRAKRLRRAELSADGNDMSLSRSIETLAVPAPAPPTVASTDRQTAASAEDLEFQEMVRNSAGAKILAEWARITSGGARLDELAVENNAPAALEPLEPAKSAAEQILEEWARMSRRPPERPGPGHGLSL